MKPAALSLTPVPRTAAPPSDRSSGHGAAATGVDGRSRRRGPHPPRCHHRGGAMLPDPALTAATMPSGTRWTPLQPFPPPRESHTTARRPPSLPNSEGKFKFRRPSTTATAEHRARRLVHRQQSRARVIGDGGSTGVGALCVDIVVEILTRLPRMSPRASCATLLWGKTECDRRPDCHGRFIVVFLVSDTTTGVTSVSYYTLLRRETGAPSAAGRLLSYGQCWILSNAIPYMSFYTVGMSGRLQRSISIPC